MKQLEGTLVYVMMDRPTDCYEKEKGQEWKAGIVITDEDVVDQFDEIYNKQPAKKVKASQFEEIYKCPLPEGAGKNVWVVTLKKNVKLSNGEPVPDKYKPRVFEKQGNTNVDITQTKLVANGSKGVISIDHWAGEKGAVARLKNVLVTDLIEYERTASGPEYTPGQEFDSDAPAEKTVEKKTPAKKVVPKKGAADNSDDGDAPW